MLIQNFDKLNSLGLIEVPDDARRSEPYNQYFGVMELTEEQMDEREECAQQLEEPVRDFLLLSLLGIALGTPLFIAAADELATRIIERDIADAEYARTLADELAESTERNQDDPWYFSDDRAMFIAENESNTIVNNRDFLDAKMRGFKRKQWKGIKDKKQRESHRELNDLIIPIDEYFQIGEAQGLFPKDMMSEETTLPEYPEETVNCRCSIKYLP